MGTENPVLPYENNLHPYNSVIHYWTTM